MWGTSSTLRLPRSCLRRRFFFFLLPLQLMHTQPHIDTSKKRRIPMPRTNWFLCSFMNLTMALVSPLSHFQGFSVVVVVVVVVALVVVEVDSVNTGDTPNAVVVLHPLARSRRPGVLLIP